MKTDKEKQSVGEARPAAKKKKPVQGTQSFIPIKEIQNGIIITRDDSYVKILEFYPINFLLKSHEEQRDIVALFANYLRIAPNNMQFKTISTKADIEKFLVVLREDMRREKNANCRTLIKNYMNLIETVGLQEGVSRRFFLILRNESDAADSVSFNKARRELEAMAHTARSMILR